MSKYIANISEMARRLGKNRTHMQDLTGRSWFPAKHGKKGWVYQEVLDAMAQDALERRPDPDEEGDRARKLSLECDKLDVVILREREKLKQEEIETKRIQGLLSPTLDHQNEVKQLLREIKMCVDSFRKSETARVRKPAQKKLIDGVCDKVLNHMAGQVERYVIKHGIGGDHCESSGGE